tara:strand:+ start:1786 stop:2217 length:432 start_codon:yes stop_codon:yes gene_type:complete
MNMQQSINGKDASRMPCCGIYALAELSGRSLQFVFDWYKEKYNRPANWKGSSYESHIFGSCLKRFGLKKNSINYSKRMTVRKFVDEYTAKGKTYLLMTGSHFLVIKGGRNEAICIDQGARCSVDNYYGKNKKVRRAVQIGGQR